MSCSLVHEYQDRYESERACCQVMDRGRGRQVILHNNDHGLAFPQSVEEAVQRVDMVPPIV